MLVEELIYCFWEYRPLETVGIAGPLGLLSFVPTFLLYIFTLLLAFICLFVFFHSCCCHAQVFLKTLVHELHISSSHTECNCSLVVIFVVVRECLG